VQGVGEDQQALLANLPPLPPMLQEAAVASGQPLMMPYQLQMMAELNKQQSVISPPLQPPPSSVVLLLLLLLRSELARLFLMKVARSV
jgi:hypothetical protein